LTSVILEALHLGPVKTVAGLRSAIFKAAVAEAVGVSREGLAGDEVADRQHHGGPDQALLGLCSLNYARWAEEGTPFPIGAFGENLVLSGLMEDEACLGDVLEGEEVRLQIAHPRVPCGTLARRLDVPGILQRVWETGRGGFYLRVLREGRLCPGETLRLASRPNPAWTVLRALHAQWKVAEAPEEALALAQVPELSAHWRERLPRQAKGEG
jgi:MOSC domain-containing protein YiiM